MFLFAIISFLLFAYIFVGVCLVLQVVFVGLRLVVFSLAFAFLLHAFR